MHIDHCFPTLNSFYWCSEYKSGTEPIDYMGVWEGYNKINIKVKIALHHYTCQKSYSLIAKFPSFIYCWHVHEWDFFYNQVNINLRKTVKVLSCILTVTWLDPVEQKWQECFICIFLIYLVNLLEFNIQPHTYLYMNRVHHAQWYQ